MWLVLAGVVNRVMEAGRPLLKTKGVAREVVRGKRTRLLAIERD